ncbi:ML domain-containing protein [Mycena alexandri]|uniref:Phosphatidylglycerol/phosphatidylinositol transfer protein n=1 Tax=Mycena alexandri TaxID=1745969 RepID=A0AAD6T3E6_9AGAR|nr:ML domain-containing protein [Mycena alexandri]
MLSRLTTLLLLLSLSLSSVILQVHAAGWEYTDCGSPSNPIQIDSIELLPDPPLPGQDLTIKVKALVTETVEEGATADVVVKLGLVKLLQKKFDVCEEARNVNASVSCPVQPGPYTVEQTVALPKEIPKGEHSKFVVLVRGFTVAEEDMLCLDLKIDFMKSLSSIFNSPF